MNRLLLLLIFVPAFGLAQQRTVLDSLKALLPATRVDTSRINLLNNISDILKRDKASDGLKYVQEAIELSSKINFKKGLATAYYNRGVMLLSTNKIDSASIDFQKAIKVYGELKYLRGQALVYNEIGTLLRIQGKQSEAISYFQQAADIYEKLNDLSGTLIA